ncbi:hypothetical protein ACFL4K_02510 [Candidatus Neomarinimicrobiota bacterium]
MPALNALSAKVYNDTATYADIVHFVHIYIIEPHPQSPDISPYSGRVSESAYSNGRYQPLTYKERVADAREMQAMVQGDHLLLVDDLTPGVKNNPLWCTYGPAPNSAYLIRQDGILEAVQTWVNVPALEEAIKALVD